MVDITKTVGTMGSNASEDVALVQLMLRVVKNAQGQPYFRSNYNGSYDQALKTAILAFQQDQKLITATTPAPFAEKPELVAPNSKTLTALIARLPADLKDIRIIPGTKTIYVEGKQSLATSSAAFIRMDKNLNYGFRAKVSKLVEGMYEKHKIVLDVVPLTGRRRDFSDQEKVSAYTNAGPGESPHQFGRAVDIGFKEFRWVAGDGTIKTDSYWLNARNLPLAQCKELWAARDAIAFKQLGLFKTNKAGDYIHVQGFADENVDMGKSLAKLLETASPTKSKWSFAGRVADKNVYTVDMGLGTAVNVGSAISLWKGEAYVNKADPVKALNAKLAIDPNFSIEKFFGVAAKPVPAVTQAAAPAKAAPLTEADIKPDYIKHLQKLLKAEMQAADMGWDSWVPTK